jgi:membrane-associated protease RseP (regulator of RpoE activity)
MRRPFLHWFALSVLGAAMPLGGMCWGQEPATDVPLEADTAISGAFKFLTRTHGNPLGVEVAPLETALRAQLGVEEGLGVVITSLTADSAKAPLGLNQHDIVLKFDECPVTSPEKFHELIGSEAGKTINFNILRQGKPLSVPVQLPQTPVYALFSELDGGTVTRAEKRYRIGVSLAEADDTLRSQLKLAGGEGLVVTGVVDDSPAAKAGIKAHDVLIKLDNKRLSTVEKVNEQIQESKDRQVTLVFLRAGQEKSCELTPQLSRETTAEFVVEELDSLHGLKKLLLRGRNLAAQPNTTDLEILLPRKGVRWVAETAPEGAAAELAELKKQLAQMQKTLAALEATLQPPAQEKR